MSFNCSVCWELLSVAVKHTEGGPRGTDVVATRCGHLYHTVCLRDWLRTQNNAGCPTCRADVRLMDCLKLYPSQDQDENGGGSKVTEMAKKIKKLQQELNKAHLEISSKQFDLVVQKRLDSSYLTHVNK